MKQGLIAPQFGLASLFDASGPQPAPLPAAAPTVVVKRRRWIQPPGETAAPADGEGDVERAPKVYRLEMTRAPGDEPGPAAAAAAAAPEIEPTRPAPLRRRRRDPITRPQLIRHDVFEVTPPSPAADEAELAPVPEADEQRYDLACRMLDEVRHELALARIARRFVESFRLPEETS